MTPQQIQTNYIESFQFTEQRKKRQAAQLVLLNNLNRGDQNIASTLLLTLLNRVMASLYDDKMQTKFLPTQGIQQQQLNSYNTLAQSDYIEMAKAKLDYDWVWDTLFFGRGYCETYKFDKRRKIMVPEVINPLVFGYDPYFENIQDWRYYWKWVLKDKYTIERLIKSGKITGIKSAKEIPGGVEQYLWQYKQQRDQATKAVEPSNEPAGSDVYQILEYYGYNDKGERCVYWTDKNFTKVLFEEKLDFDDMDLEDETKGSKWPIVAKESFRVPHSSVPFSIADLLEDKHRAKSVLLNLAYIAAKDKANPIYWYDPDKVKDVAQFFSRQINQHIPVEGDGNLAVGPLNTQDPMSPGLMNFINVLTQEANEPIGTGTALQPDNGGSAETATEISIEQQLNDMAQSLLAKVLRFGEEEFWSHWWHRYAKYGPELKDKLANIVGVNGIDTSEIDLQDFQTDFPPGVLCLSAKEAEYKKLVRRRELTQLYPQLATSMSPDGFRNFNKHVFMPLMIEDSSLVDIMYPKSIEEMSAEAQNEMLQKNELPPVLDTDDHQTHIYIHQKVQPKTWATWIHLKEHQDKLAEKNAQEQMMAQAMPQPEMPGQSQMGAQKMSPTEASAPLKAETQTNF